MEAGRHHFRRRCQMGHPRAKGAALLQRLGRAEAPWPILQKRIRLAIIQALIARSTLTLQLVASRHESGETVRLLTTYTGVARIKRPVWILGTRSASLLDCPRRHHQDELPSKHEIRDDPETSAIQAVGIVIHEFSVAELYGERRGHVDSESSSQPQRLLCVVIGDTVG